MKKVKIIIGTQEKIQEYILSKINAQDLLIHNIRKSLFDHLIESILLNQNSFPNDNIIITSTELNHRNWEAFSYVRRIEIIKL